MVVEEGTQNDSPFGGVIEVVVDSNNGGFSKEELGTVEVIATDGEDDDEANNATISSTSGELSTMC
jgi:hypothetical protein